MWHHERFTEFTRFKGEVGEPSPHLAIVGHMVQGVSLERKLWLLGCYAASYCLPTAQVLWTLYPSENVRRKPSALLPWLTAHWKGIVTRTERRCVRTPKKMSECLTSYVQWMDTEYPTLAALPQGEYTPIHYDTVWKSVEKIKFFGRYINIRLVEGLRRYCGIPARLYDIRSIGGWSPKRCLCYLYPQHAQALLVDDAVGNALTNQLAYRLLAKIQKTQPKVDEYILAAMLCEYKGAFEKRHQYVSWTIDQEPLLYDKVFNYWGKVVDKDVLWRARKDLFPAKALGEIGGWNGTRWELAKTLRDFGYNWSDLRHDYRATLASGDWAHPVLWEAQGH